MNKKTVIILIFLLVYKGLHVLITQSDSAYMVNEIELPVLVAVMVSWFCFYGAYILWDELL